jgi:MFS family permease
MGEGSLEKLREVSGCVSGCEPPPAELNPATGLLLALATFGVGYVARPVGAFFLGHVGDKLGRKTVLVFTLSGDPMARSG